MLTHPWQSSSSLRRSPSWPGQPHIIGSARQARGVILPAGNAGKQRGDVSVNGREPEETNMTGYVHFSCSAGRGLPPRSARFVHPRRTLHEQDEADKKDGMGKRNFASLPENGGGIRVSTRARLGRGSIIMSGEIRKHKRFLLFFPSNSRWIVSSPHLNSR